VMEKETEIIELKKKVDEMTSLLTLCWYEFFNIGDKFLRKSSLTKRRKVALVIQKLEDFLWRTN